MSLINYLDIYHPMSKIDNLLLYDDKILSFNIILNILKYKNTNKIRNIDFLKKYSDVLYQNNLVEEILI